MCMWCPRIVEQGLNHTERACAQKHPNHGVNQCSLLNICVQARAMFLFSEPACWPLYLPSSALLHFCMVAVTLSLMYGLRFSAIEIAISVLSFPSLICNREQHILVMWLPVAPLCVNFNRTKYFLPWHWFCMGLCICICFWLQPWGRSLLQGMIVAQPVKKFQSFNEHEHPCHIYKSPPFFFII
jgi:hypothetical protein